MEARIGGESHHFFPGSSKGLGKKPQEWVSSEWKWDGDLFVATPVNPGPLECGKKKMFPDLSLSNSTSSNSDEVEFRNPREGLSLADKRRRIVVFDEDEHGDVAGNLTLKLGGHSNGVIEEEQDTGEKKNCKRGMVQASNSNRSKCQVEGCGVDLCQSKDYHRRHKVCEMHAKASSAMVGNVIQRFCQQCSRFHLLQEFDEGKRSCRRRLAGHNKRRRKNNSDATPNGSAAADDQTMGYLLISLLRILANLNSDRSEQSKDQELLTNLLRNIASLSGPSNDNKSSGVQEASQVLHAVDTSAGTSRNVVATASLISGALPMTENFNALCPPSKTLSAAAMASIHMASANVAPSEIHCQQMCSGTSFSETLQLSGRLMSVANGLPIKSCMLPTACTSDGVRTNGFDLNTVCDDEQEVVLGCQQPENPETLRVTSNCPPWMLKDIQQRSPPQTSGNTDSTSTRSPSSSNGDAQSRTDRIVFKLFGKDPSDFPLVLRTQIFDWLSHSPTDIESYIRPGCIVLTLYFRLGVSAWDELCYDLGSSLKRLLLLAADDFWRVGWIYATVQHNVAVIYNGQVVLNKSLMMDRYGCSRILCVTPIAVPPSSRITFKVKVSNLPQCTRLYCAFEGEYLIEDTDQESVGYLDNGSSHEQFQFLNFSCVIPDAIGRGFVEVEENGLSSGFFPFIVAEEDVCAELRMLESSIDVASCDELLEEEFESERSPCMTFLHEMGWLLRRCQLRSRREVQSSCLEPFSLVRFRWILRFAINLDWPAIVKKLLDILFEGNIDSGELCPTKVALSEDLLHYAVQRNSKSIVKFLLRYKPKKNSDRDLNLFKPDMRGPCNVTPLHVAAASSNADAVLDLLTDDPGQLGVKAWRNSRDSTGFTPEDYARARGHESYIFMMQKKINRSTETCDVVLNMPAKSSFVSDSNHKRSEELKYGKQSGLEVEKSKAKRSQPPFCKLCAQHLARRRSMGTSLIYRPMLLSMVGIAAVCVCVGLLLKGPPEVDFVYPPFRWELLDWGSM